METLRVLVSCDTIIMIGYRKRSSSLPPSPSDDDSASCFSLIPNATSISCAVPAAQSKTPVSLSLIAGFPLAYAIFEYGVALGGAQCRKNSLFVGRPSALWYSRSKTAYRHSLKGRPVVWGKEVFLFL